MPFKKRLDVAALHFDIHDKRQRQDESAKERHEDETPAGEARAKRKIRGVCVARPIAKEKRRRKNEEAGAHRDYRRYCKRHEWNEEDEEIDDEGSCDELEEIRAEAKRIVSRGQKQDQPRKHGKPPCPRVCEVRRKRNRQVERKTGERENETKDSSAAISAGTFRHLTRNDSEKLVEEP